jgi:hypothetical protein
MHKAMARLKPLSTLCCLLSSARTCCSLAAAKSQQARPTHHLHQPVLHGLKEREGVELQPAGRCNLQAQQPH